MVRVTSRDKQSSAFQKNLAGSQGSLNSPGELGKQCGIEGDDEFFDGDLAKSRWLYFLFTGRAETFKNEPVCPLQVVRQV
jgi:hypothetical protein